MYLTLEDVLPIYEVIRESDTIIIHRHIRPDPDALGSQLGLQSLLKSAFPNKRVLVAGSMPHNLTWIGQMDAVQLKDYEGATIISCDTARRDMVDGLSDSMIEKADHFIKIDHHPEVDFYGTLSLVRTSASSCSELIVVMRQLLTDKLPLTESAARCLYIGILGDTGRFLFGISPTTFQVASVLCEFNIHPDKLGNQLEVMSLNEAKFMAYVQSELVFNDEGVAYVIITDEIMQRYHITKDDTHKAVNVARIIDQTLVWAVFIQEEANKERYRCRLRSKGPIINRIAMNHDGGGHPLASGANAYSLAEIDDIVLELTEVARQYRDGK